VLDDRSRWPETTGRDTPHDRGTAAGDGLAVKGASAHLLSGSASKRARESKEVWRGQEVKRERGRKRDGMVERGRENRAAPGPGRVCGADGGGRRCSSRAVTNTIVSAQSVLYLT